MVLSNNILVFDKAVALNLLRYLGKEGLTETYNEFIRDTSEFIIHNSELGNAIISEKLTTRIHTIKGNALTLGANRVGLLAKEIERYSSEQNTQKVHSLLTVFDSEFKDFKLEFHNFTIFEL